MSNGMFNSKTSQFAAAAARIAAPATAMEACYENEMANEIPQRLDCTDQALNDLHNVVGVLFGRLEAVLSRTDTEYSNESGGEPACTSPLGQRLQVQEKKVRDITSALRGILARLEL
ncbi:hypothetical protein [Bordetella phage vB_BbrM_PHB04]|uniref:Uncharacterized protein n=1 Tax=Bordetella phage vB_BbrM_PHB04 TaxID=2029657 RepID=A0A291L9X5_9CAUD|nr:hypothetical protein HOS14_gp057 [Bordetella phage vB_BbrM_PHB04]ATI15675.1 hypothetical protein [Bordetella phage vB_BbrM_PHB04]